MRVLVTDADSHKELAIVRALGPYATVFTMSSSRLSIPAWSRFCHKHIVHREKLDPSYAPDLLRVCLANSINVVVASEERSSLLLARDRDIFAKANIVLTVPPYESMIVAMNKELTIMAAERLGIPAPATRAVERRNDFTAAARDLGFPVVIKARSSYSQSERGFVKTPGVKYATTPAQLEEYMSSWPKDLPLPLLQEYIPGRGAGAFFLIGHSGQVLSEFAHRRDRDVLPTGSASALRHSVALDSTLREYAVRLLNAIGWRGVAMVEFKISDTSGVPYLMEVNGRFWGSLALSIAAGANFPKLLVWDALGLPTEPASYRSGVYMRWWLGDLLRLGYVLKGRPEGFTGPYPKFSDALREFLGPQPPGTINEVLRWDDPAPAAGELLHYLQRLIARRIYASL